MKKVKLTNSEKRIETELENNEWKPIKNKKQYIKKLKTAARKTLVKDRRMNIRINSRDMDMLKAKALEEGLPYQSLVTSILHKFVNGKLK